MFPLSRCYPKVLYAQCTIANPARLFNTEPQSKERVEYPLVPMYSQVTAVTHLY